MEESLREEIHRMILENDFEPSEFFQSIRNREHDLLLDFYKWIITTFDYESRPKLIKTAYFELARLRDHTIIDALEQLRDRWKNTYYNEYEYLMALLQNARAGAKCNCNVYQDSRYNVPPYMDDLEKIGEAQREYDEGWTTDIIIVRCRTCRTEWEVEIDYMYHYPHSHWRKKRD